MKSVGDCNILVGWGELCKDFFGGCEFVLGLGCFFVFFGEVRKRVGFGESWFFVFIVVVFFRICFFIGGCCCDDGEEVVGVVVVVVVSFFDVVVFFIVSV